MDSWKNLMIAENGRGTMIDDFIQDWFLRNTASTSQPEPPTGNTEAPFSSSIDAVHLETPFSKLLELLNQDGFLSTPDSTPHQESTSQPKSSPLLETLGEDNRTLGKRPMSDTYTQFEHSVGEVHHGASTSNPVELGGEVPDCDPLLEWLVKDSWAFICNYDRETEKRSRKKGSVKTATLEISPYVRLKRPYEFRKRTITLVVSGEEIEISGLPNPVCSCTGTPRKCFSRGKGGWLSACCTATLSMYPLPTHLGRSRNASIIGRKMGLSTYTKVIETMYAKGHDFCNPIDLKDYWADHGANRFFTIR
jgi:hypothetical protein